MNSLRDPSWSAPTTRAALAVSALNDVHWAQTLRERHPNPEDPSAAYPRGCADDFEEMAQTYMSLAATGKRPIA